MPADDPTVDPTDDQPVDLDLVAASLRAEGTDLRTFTEALAAKLEEALPGRARIARAGFRGRGDVQAIEVDAGGERLALRVHRGAVQTTASRVSGGIVLKTEAVDTDEWLRRLGAALADEARRSATTRQALDRLLNG